MAKIRKLTENDVTFTVLCEPEDIEIEGNCSAIDEETDRAQEKWVRNQLRSGNTWAWCSVKVTASWKDFESSEYLGGCSYRSEEEFTEPGGYYDDLKAEALEQLNRQIEWYYSGLTELVED